jgi:hypothetical protein
MAYEILFLTLFVLLIVLYIMRKSISKLIFDKAGIIISSKSIGYAILILIAIVSILAVLLSNTKDKYNKLASGSMSEKSVENTKVFEKKNEDKPHRWFDINFDIFN